MKGNLKFTSEVVSKNYFDKGYVITSLLNQDLVKRLETIFYNNFDVQSLPQVYDTIAATDVITIQKVNDEVNEICQTVLAQTFSNYRIVGSIFFLKKSGEDSYKGMHLDATMTLDGFNNIGVWIPLCDIDEYTGKICLLDNSHRFLPPYHTPSMPCPYSEVETVIEPYLTCLTMKAGDALFFNNSILHCTQKNVSGKTRIAVIIKLIDENAPLVTAYYDENGEIGKKVKLYEHEYDFFITGKFRLPVPPANSRFREYVTELPKSFSADEILSLLEK